MALHFTQVVIIGVGLIGGSLGMILRRKRLAARVIGVGRRVENLKTAVELGAIDELAGYRATAPHAVRAHPTEDHLMPFFVALGAGGLPARRINLGFDMGSLGMDCYAFGE